MGRGDRSFVSLWFYVHWGFPSGMSHHTQTAWPSPLILQAQVTVTNGSSHTPPSAPIPLGTHSFHYSIHLKGTNLGLGFFVGTPTPNIELTC